MSIYVSKPLDTLRDVWKLASSLKLQKRRGWSEKTKIRHPESVADHSFAVALLGLVEAGRREYNVERTMKLALIHDLEEAITGDLTPQDKERLGSSKVRKRKRVAIQRIIDVTPLEIRTELRQLWRELLLNQSKEARLVHELDKLEMALQAHEYAKNARNPDFVDFYKSADGQIRDARLRRTFESLRR